MLSRLVGMNDPHAHTRTAVVVGGGPAGLIAAAKLADAGIATTLLEASSMLGGRAASKRHAGFDLNQGAHALYVGGPGMRQLRSLGIDPERWNPVSHRSVFLRAGRVRRSPGGTGALMRWLGSALRTRAAELERTSVNEWLSARCLTSTHGPPPERWCESPRSSPTTTRSVRTWPPGRSGWAPRRGSAM